jgi:hypothetical protein
VPSSRDAVFAHGGERRIEALSPGFRAEVPRQKNASALLFKRATRVKEALIAQGAAL